MRLPIFGNAVKLGTGIAVGAAVVIFAPIVAPVIRGVLKSLTKAGIKGGMLVYEKSKVALAEMQETVEDLAAEAKAETAIEQVSPPASKQKKAATA